jgi:ABC-type glycerol-3-phosphate transport system substrate-binding protein
MERAFGIDLLATVAIISSIWVGEYLAAAVVELMLGSGELLENIIFNTASKAISNITGNPMGKAGNLYIVPFVTDIIGLYYRTDLFEKAKLQPPKTWDELLDAAKKKTS